MLQIERKWNLKNPKEKNLLLAGWSDVRMCIEIKSDVRDLNHSKLLCERYCNSIKINKDFISNNFMRFFLNNINFSIYTSKWWETSYLTKKLIKKIIKSVQNSPKNESNEGKKKI